MTVRATEKYRERISRTCSGSRDSDIGVKPTRSPKSTEVSRRSETTAGTRCTGTASAGMDAPAVSDEPHDEQNRPLADAPQPGQAVTSAVPHEAQNRASGVAGDPQEGQAVATSATAATV